MMEHITYEEWTEEFNSVDKSEFHTWGFDHVWNIADIETDVREILVARNGGTGIVQSLTWAESPFLVSLFGEVFLFLPLPECHFLVGYVPAAGLLSKGGLTLLSILLDYVIGKFSQGEFIPLSEGVRAVAEILSPRKAHVLCSMAENTLKTEIERILRSYQEVLA